MWTGIKTLVAGVTTADTLAGSIWNDAASTSANTGSAKFAVITLNVATKVYGGRITSSPGPTFKAPSALSSAVVPDEVATQYFAFIRSAKTSSNSFTRPESPAEVRPHLPERRTSRSAFSSPESQTGQAFADFALGVPAPAPEVPPWAEAAERPRQRPAPAVAAPPMNLRRDRGAFMRVDQGGSPVRPRPVWRSFLVTGKLLDAGMSQGVFCAPAISSHFREDLAIAALTFLRPFSSATVLLESRMLKLLFSRATLALLVALPAAFAQIGDRQDKKGEVQKALVPPEKIPPAPALTPEEALKSFKLAPGIKLELAAAEPLVQEPVAITFGPDGRMWVVEMRGYMPDLDGNGEDAPVGRVVVLTDRNGDGRYDDSKVFADQLVLPRAIALVDDGVLVGAPPELLFLRDTDGDGRADKREVIATDYGVRVDPKRPHLANPERAPNSLLWAFDNWIYSAAYTKKFRYVNGAWETGGTLFRGQWGLTQDDFGRLYYGSNSDSLRVDVIFSDYLQRNPHYPRLGGTNVNGAEDQFVWPARVNPGINRGYRPEMLRDGKLKEFTAACGWWVYRGDLMPELAGNLFVAEPSGNFVRRTLLTSENGTVRGRNAYAEQKQEFIASTDERFRPVSFATGPDGALYIVDLYRGVLQHRISLTSYLRKQSEDRKLVHPQHLGRIYRVVPAGRPVPRVPRIATLSTAQWVERLGHANGWWRDTAQRILVERRDTGAVPAIRNLVRNGSSA